MYSRTTFIFRLYRHNASKYRPMSNPYYLFRYIWYVACVGWCTSVSVGDDFVSRLCGQGKTPISSIDS